MDPVELTRTLVRYDTINPPGGEQPCARHVAALLERAGFDVRTYAFAEGRTSLVASLPGIGEQAPLCWTGHLDTVPLGRASWNVEPLGGELSGERLYGRGSTDMKAGVAAAVVAACERARGERPRRGLTLVLTAGEETGCEGAAHLAAHPGALGRASALLVGEPTANRPFVGHKGALWLQARTTGRTAHGSTPEQGDNAIYKAAHAICALQQFQFDAVEPTMLGVPTLNVGTVEGGMNINSVPDEAWIGIDIRSVPGQRHDDIVAQLQTHIGPNVELRRHVDVEHLFTAPDDGWVNAVRTTVDEVRGAAVELGTATFFTDGALLHRAYGGVPAVVLGPGEPSMAHQTDEYCDVERIREAAEIYRRLFR